MYAHTQAFAVEQPIMAPASTTALQHADWVLTCQWNFNNLSLSEKRFIRMCQWHVETGRAITAPQAQWLQDIAARFD